MARLRRAGGQLTVSDQTSPMLALTRSTRAANILSLHARALSTIPHNSGSLNPDAERSSNDPVLVETVAIQTNSSAECMIVYPWNGIRSSAEGLAVARAVQGKYGPAKEVLFSRVRFAQLMSVIVTFADTTCMRRTRIASTTSSHTFGLYLIRTCASAFHRSLQMLH